MSEKGDHFTIGDAIVLTATLLLCTPGGWLALFFLAIILGT